jgi:predicted Na+-dependent transporter
VRLQWRANQKADARKQYWDYWFDKALVTVGVLAGIIAVLVAAIFLKEKLGIKKPNFFTRLSPLQTILLVFGAVFVLMILVVLVAYSYMLIRYGKIGRY